MKRCQKIWAGPSPPLIWTKFSFSQENFPKCVCVCKCVCVLAFVFCSGGSRLRWSASSSGHDLTHCLAQLPASPRKKPNPGKHHQETWYKYHKWCNVHPTSKKIIRILHNVQCRSLAVNHSESDYHCHDKRLSICQECLVIKSILLPVSLCVIVICVRFLYLGSGIPVP